jgi:hypothetical protein
VRNGNAGNFDAGGIVNFDTFNSRSSIIAGNTAADFSPDFFGTLNSQDYNLIGNTVNTNINGDTTGNILNQNARLAPLGFYGGQTITQALLSGSPAINNGNTATSPTNDQRGAARIGTADIRAFELNNSANGRRQRHPQCARFSDRSKRRDGVARTNAFGKYSFDEVGIGATYVLTVTAKEHLFSPQLVNLQQETTEVNFIGQ